MQAIYKKIVFCLYKSKHGLSKIQIWSFISPAAELDGSCIEALGASQSSLHWRGWLWVSAGPTGPEGLG